MRPNREQPMIPPTEVDPAAAGARCSGRAPLCGWRPSGPFSLGTR